MRLAAEDIERLARLLAKDDGLDPDQLMIPKLRGFSSCPLTVHDKGWCAPRAEHLVAAWHLYSHVAERALTLMESA